MFLFGAMMYAVVEGLVQMFREGKAIRDDNNNRTKNN
jgi:hypothetical protein